jgi:hypothetical protein
LSQQPPKKSGSRDINELKARLGLKKGAPAPASGSGPAAKPNGSPSGGVVPPPGLAVPPPPGANTGPVVPNAADDPFGAMNAMAQIGTAQRAPEIVIVNDGKPVESVSAGTRGAQIGKYLVIALVPFVLGIAIRGISKDANAYNEGINGAKALLSDVKAVKQKMAFAKQKLSEPDVAKARRRGKVTTDILNNLHPDKLEVKQGQVISRKQNIGDTMALSVMEYYAEVAALQQMVKDHIGRAQKDDALIATSIANEGKAELPKDHPLARVAGVKYGVLIWSPNEEDAKIDPSLGAKLVELGPPYCADGKLAATGTCPENAPPEAPSFRTGPGEGWQRADLFTDVGSAVPTRKVMTFLPSGALGALLVDCANSANAEQCEKNPGGAASLSIYDRRVENIIEKIDNVITLGNALEAKLAPKANESPKFTFFM